MQAIADYVHRFIPFIPPLSTIAVDIAVNTYLLPFDFQGGQGELAVIGQLRGINCMQFIIAKKPGLKEMVQNIHQKVHLLNKGDGTSKLAQLSMINPIFLVQRLTDKNPVLLLIQTEICFRTEFSITNPRELYRLE
jgi:hypothetical protein